MANSLAGKQLPAAARNKVDERPNKTIEVVDEKTKITAKRCLCNDECKFRVGW